MALRVSPHTTHHFSCSLAYDAEPQHASDRAQCCTFLACEPRIFGNAQSGKGGEKGEGALLA